MLTLEALVTGKFRTPRTGAVSEFSRDQHLADTLLAHKTF
jgi:hypothetical protein